MAPDYYKIRALRKEFLENLLEIEVILRSGSHTGQANYIDSLKRLFVADQIEQFAEKANAVDMWGGAGAVWELYFEEKEKDRVFAVAMKTLLNLMNSCNFEGERATSLKSVFDSRIK